MEQANFSDSPALHNASALSDLLHDLHSLNPVFSFSTLGAFECGFGNTVFQYLFVKLLALLVVFK